MKRWAEFYRLIKPPCGEARYVDVLGSDGIAYMDGRFSMMSMKAEAESIGRQRGFDGYRIARGESLSRPFYLTAAVRPIAK